MAKKAKSEDGDQDKIGISNIIKKYGEVVSTGSQFFHRKKDLSVQKVSPSWDLGLNGGILEGSWVIFSGNPKCGKSSTALQIAANAQKEGRNVIYIDAESRLKNYNLSGVEGLDLDKIQIVHSTEEKTLSGEEMLEICSDLLKMPKNQGALCIIDSTSSLVPRSELDAEASGSLRATLPKLLSHWVKKTAQVITNNRIIIILITHYITNTSGYGKTKVPDCGVMVQYQADTRIDFVKTEPWEEEGEKVGIICTAEISCSSLGSSGKEVKSFIRFGKGIDFVKETIELGELYGLINKSGSWFNLEFLENHEGYKEKADEKFQGKTNLYNHLNDNKDILALLEKELSEILK